MRVVTDNSEPAAQDEIAWLRDQLLRCQRLSTVGTVASGVAHEFNNILTTILNHAKMAQKQNVTPESKDQSLEKIVAASQRAAAIVHGMLGMARGSMRREVTDLCKLVDEALLLAGKDLSKHRVTVEKIYKGPVLAEVVPIQIEQVLLNLLINAKQAMPHGGVVRVEVLENSPLGLAEISVADAGCGMSPGDLGHIFEPFYTTKTPDSDNRGGTGLGLSICRQIIDQHRGRIRVQSALGKGSIFTIKLPAHVESARKAA